MADVIGEHIYYCVHGLCFGLATNCIYANICFYLVLSKEVAVPVINAGAPLVQNLVSSLQELAQGTVRVQPPQSWPTFLSYPPSPPPTIRSCHMRQLVTLTCPHNKIANVTHDAT